jgi:hypothetical protein
MNRWGTLLERFWVKVDKRGPDECWPWRGAQGAGGYGTIRRAGGGNAPAHRIAYELFVGPIPVGLDIDHTCHDPETCAGGDGCPHRGCVNPAHLEPLTHRENVLRGNTIGRINAAKTHCKRGHPLSGDNLYLRPDGGRQCKACTRMHRIAFDARQKAER